MQAATSTVADKYSRTIKGVKIDVVLMTGEDRAIDKMQSGTGGPQSVTVYRNGQRYKQYFLPTADEARAKHAETVAQIEALK